MNITTILIIVLAIAGVVYFFPRVPRLVQIVAAVVGLVVCFLVLLNLAGVPVSF